MKPVVFKGSAVALVTPMNSDGSINYDTLSELLDFQLENGTDAIVVAGTTGESATLEDGEHLELIDFTVKKISGRIPVIAGVGSNNTRHAVLLSREAEKLGADALLHVTPYYNKTSQTGLYLHFKACADEASLPIILYNVPTRTGMNILPETYRKLKRDRQYCRHKGGKRELFTDCENLFAVRGPPAYLLRKRRPDHLCPCPGRQGCYLSAGECCPIPHTRNLPVLF